MHTRTAGAAVPLVLESWQPSGFLKQILPQTLPQILHKPLPQTTTIIRESISTTTPIFVPIQQCFNFTTKFTTHFTTNTNLTTNHYQYLLPPPTMMFYVPKRNTDKCFDRPVTIFNFTTHLPQSQILPQTTTNISPLPPPWCFLYIIETQANILRFWGGCKDLARTQSSSRSTDTLAIGFWFQFLLHSIESVLANKQNMSIDACTQHGNKNVERRNWNRKRNRNR